MALSTVMLVCDLVDGRGQPVSFGSVKLTPNTTLTDPGDQVIVTQQTVEVPFSAEGSPSVVLLATDDAGLSPSGWTWGASFNVTGGPSSFSFFLPAGPVSFTATDASPAVFTFTPTTQLTELPDGTIVELSGGSLPAGFTAATPYYVVAASGHTFQLSATAGGSAIASTSTGSGTAQVTQWRLSAIAPTGTVPLVSDYLLAANNLLDVDSPSTALANLGGASQAYAAAQAAAAQAAAIAASLPALAQASVSASGALALNTLTTVTAATALTMTLPSATTGALIVVERESASAASVAVTGNIRGVAAQTITLSLASESEMFLGSGGSWWPIGGHKTLGSLDSHYLYAPAPSGDTSGATDAAAVNALLASGAKVILRPSTSSAPYWINATLKVYGYGALQGAGEFSTWVKMAAGANLAAMVSNDAYLGNFTTSGNPVSVSDLALDGNKANNPSAGDAVILLAYRSQVRDVYIANPNGNGVTFSDTGASGTVISNSAVENRAMRVTVDTPGGRGIWVKDTGVSGKVTDGYITGCVVNTPAGDYAIKVERSAGWYIDTNHVYACQQGGFYLDQFWDTFFHDNEVDGYGQAGGANSYAGIAVQNVITGREGSMHDNQCSTAEQSASSYSYYSVRCPAVTVGLDFHDNFAHKDSGTGTSSTAYSFIASGGGALTVYGRGNSLNGPATASAISGGGSVTFADVAPGVVQNYGGLFGSGANGTPVLDGTATFSWASLVSSTYTLSGDIYVKSLTVNSGVTLVTAGYRVFCQGTVINNGTISAAGNAGSASGTAGSGTPTGTVVGGHGGGAGNTGAGTAGISATNGTGYGNGGAGGTGSGGGAGSGGTSFTSGSTYLAANPSPALAGVYTANGSAVVLGGGPGGGGGGGDGTNKGGGGGSGGGVIVIFAHSVVNNGTVTAQGGAGGTPGTTTGGCGGGGGGAGGLILIYTLAAWTAGTTNVAGGAGAAGVGTGASGSTGGTGTVLNLVLA